MEATLRLQLPAVSKPLTTLGRGCCPNTRLQPGKSAVPTRALLHTWLFEDVDDSSQNRGRWGGGCLGLTFPRTVRHGFGSSSGCSSFTTPTQPYSYRSSSSLLLHRPSGCIWETSGEKASVGRLQACRAPAVPCLRRHRQEQPRNQKAYGVGGMRFSTLGGFYFSIMSRTLGRTR